MVIVFCIGVVWMVLFYIGCSLCGGLGSIIIVGCFGIIRLGVVFIGLIICDLVGIMVCLWLVVCMELKLVGLIVGFCFISFLRMLVILFFSLLFSISLCL